MASNASFDISTGADLQEVDNAVNQALKEIAQRYDFKGTHCTIEFDRAKAEIRLAADDEFRMDAVVDVLQTRMIKRGVPVKNLEFGDLESRRPASRCGALCRSRRAFRRTRPRKSSRLSRTRASRRSRPRIQGDEIRVTSPSKDDLQAVIALLRGQDFGIELKFGNYRG